MRFMPLRKGVHRIERLLITGMGDDWNFIMRSVPAPDAPRASFWLTVKSPVLDVVVE